MLSISVVVRKRAGPPTRPGVDQESSTITPTSPTDIAASGDNERHVPNGRLGGGRRSSGPARCPPIWSCIRDSSSRFSEGFPDHPKAKAGGCWTTARWKTIEARGSGEGLREPGGVSETVLGSPR